MKKTTKTRRNVYIVLFALLLSTSTYSISPKEFYEQKCVGCHQVQGQGKFGFAPKLAGQYWPYLRDQIRDIKLGRRDNGLSPVMVGLFKVLTSKDIQALAKYIEGMENE